MDLNEKERIVFLALRCAGMAICEAEEYIKFFRENVSTFEPLTEEERSLYLLLRA